MRKYLTAALAIVTGLAWAPSPLAAADTKQALSLAAEREDFSQKLGSRRSVKLDYRWEEKDTSLTFTTAAGERKSVVSTDRAIGGGLTVTHKWSASLSSRSQLFVSQGDPVFARLDVSQDFTATVVKDTTVTLGARFARFHGGRDVRFGSAGIRRYFKGGSIAYRMSLADPDGASPHLAHLINLAVRDGAGGGQTRVWLSTGEAAYTRPQLGTAFSGKDRAAVLQRTQPIFGPVSLAATVGIASYGRPGRDVKSKSFGLGLTTKFGSDADASLAR